MRLQQYAFFFVLAFTLSVGLTPLVRWVALRKGWLARPTTDRWHKKTTALMGGIAIFCALTLSALFVVDFSSLGLFIHEVNGIGPKPSIGLVVLIGAAFLFLLGLIDDLYTIKPHHKLIGQIVTASLVVYFGFRLHWFGSLTIDTMATLLWIVGITNAFNLIDNMDGLCAGIGAVASVSLAALYLNNAPEAAVMALIMAASLSGFLIYNYNPAKIFMGDCGSLVIGFSISVLTLYYAETNPGNALAVVFVPVLILLVPILDTTLVTVIRLLSGRKASTGGRDHTSHRLVLMGFSEKTAVLFLYGVGAVAGLAAVFVNSSDTLTSPAVILPTFVSIIMMGVYLSQLRVYPEKEFSRLRNSSFTPILLELTYKRHMVLVSLDFVLVAFAYYLSYRLRFPDTSFSFYFGVFLQSLPVVIACKLLIYYTMGVYQGIWSYISTRDVFVLIRASLAATLVVIAVVTFIFRFENYSKGLFIIDFLLSTGLLLAARGSFRLFLETHKRKTLTGDKVFIYGAGRAGELLLREILNNKALQVNPIGFIDDDKMKKGKKIQGFPIFGDLSEMDRIVQKYKPDGVLVSFTPNNHQNEQNRSVESMRAYCRKHNLYLKQFAISLHNMTL